MISAHKVTPESALTATKTVLLAVNGKISVSTAWKSNIVEEKVMAGSWVIRSAYQDSCLDAI